MNPVVLFTLAALLLAPRNIARADGKLMSATMRNVTGTQCEVPYGEQTVDLEMEPGKAKTLGQELAVPSVRTPSESAPLATLHACGERPPSQLDFAKLIPATLPRSAVFRQDGWCLWDPCPGKFGGGVFQYAMAAPGPLGPFLKRHPKPMVDKQAMLKTDKPFNFNIDDHFEMRVCGRNSSVWRCRSYCWSTADPNVCAWRHNQ